MLKNVCDDATSLIWEKIKKALNKERKLSYAAAAEVIADASEDMLQDSRLVNNLDESEKGKIKSFPQNFAQKVKEIFQHLTGGHKENAALREMKNGVYHYLEGLQDLWDAGFDEILENSTIRQRRGHAGAELDEESPVGTRGVGRHVAKDGEARYGQYYGKHAPAMEGLQETINDGSEDLSVDATEMVTADEEVPDSFYGTKEEYQQYMADIVEDSKTLNSEERKERERWYQEQAIKNSDRDQDYFDNIDLHDDIVVVQVPKVNVPRLANGRIDKKAILTIVKNSPSADTVKGRSVAFCDDIEAYVELEDKGVSHGYWKYSADNDTEQPSPAALLNARASMVLPDLLKNAVEVNRSTKRAISGRPYGHVLMAVYEETDNKGKVEYYSVRMVVEHNENKGAYELVDFGVVGRLHAANAKKIQSPQPGRINVSDDATSAIDSVLTYSIADLIVDVKDEFGDTFSVGAYQKAGLTRNKSDFSADLMYSDRDLPEGITIRDYLRDLKPTSRMNETEKYLLKKYQEQLKVLEEKEKLVEEQDKNIGIASEWCIAYAMGVMLPRIIEIST